MGCMNPGNKVFQVLDETPAAEIGKSGENDESMWRRIWARQFQVGFTTDSITRDTKVLELGC